MASPFVYGRIATGENFTDREEETRSLARDFINLTNTILISPRRWGKSSLVRQAAKEAVRLNGKIRFCFLDIFNVRTEDEFYEKLASEVIQATSSRIEELLANISRYAASLIPLIQIGDPVNPLTLQFKTREVRKNADIILDLAERIATEKHMELVICIDEFQQIASFADPDAFQAKLRSHWQTHQHVAYCLYGSRRHMMIEVFNNREKPFFRFGKTLFLEKIAREKWPPFIMGKFEQTGKHISATQCERIAALVDDNPYYIQQLSEEVWNLVQTETKEEDIDQALETILRSQGSLNLALTNMLTITQQNLLHAIVAGEKELTSARVMEQYGLKNSLTVQRAKNALVKQDIIDSFGKQVTLEDPIYARWLKEIYFK